MFLVHILRRIQKPISSLPDHFGIGVKMTSKIFIFFILGFWAELSSNLGLGFSVWWPAAAAAGRHPKISVLLTSPARRHGAMLCRLVM